MSVNPLYATASRDKATGDVIVKLVNITDEPIATTINIAGGGKIAKEVRAIVLAGERSDQNGISEPTKVAPHLDSHIQRRPDVYPLVAGAFDQRRAMKEG